MRELQRKRMRWIHSVTQPHQAISDEDGVVMVITSMRVRAHEDPVDIRRHLSEKGRSVASVQVVEDLGDMTFAGIRGTLWRGCALVVGQRGGYDGG